jgi:hypothetical protein
LNKRAAQSTPFSLVAPAEVCGNILAPLIMTMCGDEQNAEAVEMNSLLIASFAIKQPACAHFCLTRFFLAFPVQLSSYFYAIDGGKLAKYFRVNLMLLTC